MYTYTVLGVGKHGPTHPLPSQTKANIQDSLSSKHPLLTGHTHFGRLHGTVI
jgi:hypothetical protein